MPYFDEIQSVDVQSNSALPSDDELSKLGLYRGKADIKNEEDKSILQSVKDFGSDVAFAASNPSARLANMRVGMEEGLAGIQKMRADELERQGSDGFYPESYAKEVKKSSEDLADNADALKKGIDLTYTPKSSAGKFLKNLEASVPATLAGVAASSLVGPIAGYTIGVGLGAGQVGGQKYLERRKMGDSPEMAENASLIHSTSEAAFEMAPLPFFNKLFKAAKAGLPILGPAIKDIFAEGIQEVGTGIVQGAEDSWRGQGKDPAGLEGVKNYVTSGKIAEDALLNFAGGALMSGTVNLTVLKPIQMSYKPMAIQSVQGMKKAVQEATDAGLTTVKMGTAEVPIAKVEEEIATTVENFGISEEDLSAKTGNVSQQDSEDNLNRAVEGLKEMHAAEQMSKDGITIDLEESSIVEDTVQDIDKSKLAFDTLLDSPQDTTTVYASDGIDPRFKSIVEAVHNRIGTKTNIALLSLSDFDGAPGSAFREQLLQDGQNVFNIEGGRIFKGQKDGKTFYTIAVNTKGSSVTQSAIVMHEAIGHVTMLEHFDSAPLEIQDLVRESFRKWRTEVKSPESFMSPDTLTKDFGDSADNLKNIMAGNIGDSASMKEARLFQEFMAHQLSSKIQQRPETRGIMKQFWDTLRRKIQKIFEAFKADYLDIATGVDGVDAFIDHLFGTVQTSAEAPKIDVENFNTKVDEKRNLVQAVFDSMFEIVDGKRTLKNAWRFKKVFTDGKRGLVSIADIKRSGISYKEENGKTVVYKGKDVLFTIPWDHARNLSQATARMIATNLRDLYILASMKPQHVSRAKANATKMLNTSTGKMITVKMGSRAARVVEIMWERAASMAQEEGITERQAFLKIISGEGSAFSSLRPGIAGTELTGSSRKNMDRWIAMHATQAAQEMPDVVKIPDAVLIQEDLGEPIVEPVKALPIYDKAVDQVRDIIETWWNKARPSERVQDFEGLTQKVIFYFDLDGKDYTEVSAEIRNLIGATIKDVMQEKTGVEIQSEIKNKAVAVDEVLALNKAGMDTTLQEIELRSFNINVSEEVLKDWAGTDNFVDARSTYAKTDVSGSELMDILTRSSAQAEQLADEHMKDGKFWEDVENAMSVRQWVYFEGMLRQDQEWLAASRKITEGADWREGSAMFKAIAERYDAMPIENKVAIAKTAGGHMQVSVHSIGMVAEVFARELENWRANEADAIYADISREALDAVRSVGPRYKYDLKEGSYVDKATGELIPFDRHNPGSMTEDFVTGKPVAITNLFHGTTDDIHAFRSKHLGSLTGAQSATMGFFMAAHPEVAGSYPMIMGKPRPLNRSAKIMNLYGKKIFIDVRDIIRQAIGDKIEGIDWTTTKIVYQNIKIDEAASLATQGYTDFGYMSLRNSTGETLYRVGMTLTFDEGGNLGIELETPWSFDNAVGDINFDEVTQGKYFKKLEKKVADYAALAQSDDMHINWGDPDDLYTQEAVPAGANVVKTVGKMQNPFVKDWEGGSYKDGGWSAGIKAAKAAGHDGVIYLNAKDGVGYGHRIVTNIFVFFNGHQVKSDFATVGAFRSKSGKLTAKEDMPVSFDLFGNYEKVVEALEDGKVLASYIDPIDGFKKAYFADRDLSFVPLSNGFSSHPGNNFIRPRWKKLSEAGTLTLDKVITHEDLFKVYPRLKTLKVRFHKSIGDNIGGSADWKNWTINIDYSQDVDTVRSVILHELQHIIQAEESWAGGQSMLAAHNTKQFRQAERSDLHFMKKAFNAINNKIAQGQSYRDAISDYKQENRFNGNQMMAANTLALRAADVGWANVEVGLRDQDAILSKDTIFESGSALEAYRHAAGEEEARRAEALFYLTGDEVKVAFKQKGIAAGSDISNRSLLYKTDSKTLQVMLSATSTVEEGSNDEAMFASYAMLNSFDLKIKPQRRKPFKETEAGPYKGIIKQARKATKTKVRKAADPVKVEARRKALFSLIEKMDLIKEAGERQGLSISEVMMKMGFSPDEVKKDVAKYNRHKSKFSQSETIIRLAEIAGLINEESGRSNLESLIKVMFPAQTVAEPQEDGTTKSVVYPGSDGSLQSLGVIAKDMLINKIQVIISNKSGERFDIESEVSVAESIAIYKSEWTKEGIGKKLAGLLKYVQSSAADFLETTKSGNELSFRLRRYLLQKTVMQRNYLVELNDFARLYPSAESRQAFYEVISGEREAQSEDEHKFANLVKSINRSYGSEMELLQVRIYKKNGSFTFFKYSQDMSDSYFPHMWKSEWFNNPTNDMIQSLLDAGEASDRQHAKRLIQDFRKRQIRDKKFANVETARETELGGWITDPIDVYQKYVLGASARLASLKEFGSAPEVVLAQLSLRHLKESRDPEALSKTRDLINRVLGTKIEDGLAKEAKAGLSYGVMYSVGLLLQHAFLVQPGVMANMGAIAGYRNLIKGIAKAAPALWGNKDGLNNKRWAELAGVLAFTVNRELNDIVMEDRVRTKTDKILRSFGITQIDASMRIVGAIIGKLYATDLALSYIDKQDQKSYMRLKRLGIKPEKLLQPDYMQTQEWFVQDLRMAALAFTEDTNFVLDPMRTPSIIQGHPIARLFFLFKNFAFQQHRFMLRLIKEDKGKALKSIVGSLAGGSLIMLFKMLLQGDDPEKVLERDGIVKLIWRAFMSGGGAGLFAESIGSALIPGSGPQTGMALDSPVFGLLDTVGRGGKSLYNLAEGEETDQDLHNIYKASVMALQLGALALPDRVGVPLNAAIGMSRPFTERAIAPSDSQRAGSYMQ